jgi:hypothetical protein
MNKAKERQLVLKAMRKIYFEEKSHRIDWMGYPITVDNHPTYHHIVKREELLRDGKSIEATVENGAYLGKISHEKLHQIELIDHDLYICWNDLFLAINRMGIPPIKDVMGMINQLQELTEKAIEEYNSSKRIRK